ncbi:methyl-accepting chemotaxis protein [Paenibacillus methanolicus]|uniref:Methyl-accepting chemotaxis protein n=1 Tax=Paenibacillus methanolicus TaxID=582686 RepID=A0A5S5BY35_9BACL|nr:methyl-accepting chemotaxis protein [Paenibacillus methanolicus]TYP71238.1 methyl-accepting chemotaxis protein [Paenibacillus methanolicus]
MRSVVREKQAARQPVWRRIFQSIGFKIGLIMVASIVAFVAASGMISYGIAKRALEKKVVAAYGQTAQQTSQKLDFLYKTYDGLLLKMMVDEKLADSVTALADHASDSSAYAAIADDIDLLLQDYMYSDQSITSIELLRMDGTLIPTKSGLLKNRSYGEDAWFQSIVRQDGQSAWLGSNLPDNRNTNPTFSVGRVIRSAGQTGGYCVILIDVDLSAMGEQINGVEMGEGTVQVISPDGSVVYDKKVGGNGGPSQLTMPAELKEKTEGSYADSAGRQQIVFAQSAINGWQIAGYIPFADLYKETEDMFGAIAIVLATACAASIIIAALTARFIGRPLARMRDLMRQGAEGDLSVRTQAKAADEIGQLGASFDRMMSNIGALVEQTRMSAQEVLTTAHSLASASASTELAAKDVAAATADIAKGGEELALGAERGKELTDEAMRQTDDMMAASGQMSAAAEGVMEASERGTASMRKLREKTAHSEEVIHAVTEKAESLNAAAASIGKVLGLLNDIMKQTNILSLNAAIEASRAGSAGKGFMVVADEVRQLAERSRLSIEEIRGLTGTIEHGVAETAAMLSAAQPVFREQLAAVHEADELFRQTGGSMEAFRRQLHRVSTSAEVLEQIQHSLVEAMMNVSAISEQSLASSEEVASQSAEQLGISADLVALSERLQKLSNELQDSLNRFA